MLSLLNICFWQLVFPQLAWWEIAMAAVVWGSAFFLFVASLGIMFLYLSLLLDLEKQVTGEIWSQS